MYVYVLWVKQVEVDKKMTAKSLSELKARRGGEKREANKKGRYCHGVELLRGCGKDGSAKRVLRTTYSRYIKSVPAAGQVWLRCPARQSIDSVVCTI